MTQRVEAEVGRGFEALGGPREMTQRVISDAVGVEADGKLTLDARANCGSL